MADRISGKLGGKTVSISLNSSRSIRELNWLVLFVLVYSNTNKFLILQLLDSSLHANEPNNRLTTYVLGNITYKTNHKER